LSESFKELYDIARVLEQHIKQYAASAAARGETRCTEPGKRYKSPSEVDSTSVEHESTPDEDRQ